MSAERVRLTYIQKSDVNSDVDSPTLNGGVTGWRESKTDNGKLILFVQSC